MNCPTCQAPLCKDWTRCGMCGHQRLESLSPSDAASCSRGHSGQNPCQRAHNYMTYGMGIIAHRLEQGCDRKMVADFALEIRDRAEEIRSENATSPSTGATEKEKS